MRFTLATATCVALVLAAQQVPLITQQQIDELNRHRDPRPTEQYELRQKRLEVCRKKHEQTGEDINRCMKDGE